MLKSICNMYVHMCVHKLQPSQPQTKCKQKYVSFPHTHRIKVHSGIFWVRWVHLDWRQLVKSLSMSIQQPPKYALQGSLGLACVWVNVCVNDVDCQSTLANPWGFLLVKKVSGCIFHWAGGHVFPRVPPFPFVSCHFLPHFSSSSSSSNNSPSPLYSCVFPPSSFSFPVSSSVHLLLHAPMYLPWIVHPVFYPFDCCSHQRQVRMKLVHTVFVMWVFQDKLSLHYFSSPPQDKWCYDSLNPGLDSTF